MGYSGPMGEWISCRGLGQGFVLGYLARRRKGDSVGDVQGFDMTV